LTFTAAPDFESPADADHDNVYNLTVQASDGELSVTQDVVVTVTGLNDNHPAITSNGRFSVAENSTSVANVTAADADQPAQSLAYSISGGPDAALFKIDSSNGSLAFASAPDFESPADGGHDNAYNVTVQVSDGDLASTQDVTVNVTAVNDNNPVITSIGNAAIVENTTAVITVTTTDVDQPAESLTYSIAGGPDATLFNINSSTGELTFIKAPSFASPADAGADNIYNFTLQVSDGLHTTTQDFVVTVKSGG
jgi:trimeric autotransporter adhesin